ncbi:hypothetical protein [Novipirellula maiorica]|nr:hypothetical protein [Rhodopirellula maiorica]
MRKTKSQPWMLGRVPHGFWDLAENRLAYMSWLGEQLGYAKPDDWYGIQQKHFKQNYGGGLLASHYSDSPQNAVREFMPRRKWHSWLFSRATNGYWQKPENRREFMLWLEKQLGIQGKEDWYRVTKNDFTRHGGLGLLNNYYGCSVAAALHEFKPLMQLDEWRFETVPQGFWNDLENRRRYMDWLGFKLKIRTPELWYGVSVHDIREHYGTTLLTMCGGSIYRMVSEYLPKFPWKPWLFHYTPSGYWEDDKNRKEYLQWLGKELGYRTPKDWYQLREHHFLRSGGSWLFAKYYGYSPLRAAEERYPKYKWNPDRFRSAGKSHASEKALATEKNSETEKAGVTAKTAASAKRRSTKKTLTTKKTRRKPAAGCVA